MAKKKEVKVLIVDDTRLEKIRIVIEGGEVVEGESGEENKESIEIKDLKKHHEVLISPFNPADLYEVIELDQLKAEEVLIFEN